MQKEIKALADALKAPPDCTKIVLTSEFVNGEYQCTVEYTCLVRPLTIVAGEGLAREVSRFRLVPIYEDPGALQVPKPQGP